MQFVKRVYFVRKLGFLLTVKPTFYCKCEIEEKMLWGTVLHQQGEQIKERMVWGSRVK